MSATLACTFPIVVAGALLVFLPVQVPERPTAFGDQSGAGPPSDTSPLPYRQHLAYAAPYLLVSFALAYPLGVAQRALFERMRDGTAVFSHRATDLPIYAFLPAIFLGLVVAFPISYRALKWHLGPRLFEILDRPDRSRIPMSLRQTIRLFPGMTWAVAVLATLLNLAAFDTFLQISSRELHYSTFFSPRTHRYAIGDVQEMTIYSRRRAPNGNIVDKASLALRLDDGETVDTFYLIQPEQISQVIAAVERNPAFAGRVARLEGPSRDALRRTV